MVALAISGGKLIAFGANGIRFTKNYSFCSKSSHAETTLVTRLGERARGAKILVYRFNVKDKGSLRQTGVSIPCLCCQHTLKAAGVHRVIAMTKDNTVRTYRNSDLAEFDTDPYYLSTNVYFKDVYLKHKLANHLKVPSAY